MAREMGGGRAAQGLAGLAALTNLVHLALDSFYSMNAIEIALWAVAMLLVLRIVNGGDRRHWLLLGVILGAGLLNKASMLWFGAGLGVGLALTPERRWLRTPWPWMAGVIAIGCFAPFVWWQWSNGWHPPIPVAMLLVLAAAVLSFTYYGLIRSLAVAGEARRPDRLAETLVESLRTEDA